MMYYFNQIILFSDNLNFALVKYKKKNQLFVKLIGYKKPELNYFNKSEDATNWQSVNKLDTSKQYFWVNKKDVINIDNKISQWLIFKANFIVLKKRLFSKPVPHPTVLRAKLYKKQRVKDAIVRNYTLFKLIGQFKLEFNVKVKGNEKNLYNYICSRIGFRYSKKEVFEFVQNLIFLKNN
jgi:hypothetical protein